MTGALLAGRRVLIVEDQYLIAEDMRPAVTSLGGQPLGPFPSAQAALAGLEGWVDLALLDVNLGGAEVYPLADQRLARGIPVAFATGYDRSMIPERYLPCGFLQKPVTVVSLQAAASTLFGDMTRNAPGH